tara:strand:- start:151 stop:723 length:573 start_codon:yes stop_codon:yes gene_type:complete
MDNHRNRPLIIRSHERHMTYKSKWESRWYYKLSPTYQHCFNYLWDYADCAGFVDPDRLDDFNYKVYGNDKSEYNTQEEVFFQLNKYREVLRDIPDGYWFFEDYLRIQSNRMVLNASKGIDRNQSTGNQVKGIVRCFVEHNLDPSTVRGISFIPPDNDTDLFHSEEGYNQALMKEEQQIKKEDYYRVSKSK